MIVHLWSGPRSLSTCTMYSFGQRSDTMVIDEPLYAHWLARNPDSFRPYRDELLQAQDSDGARVMENMHKLDKKPIVVAKQIAKQFSGLNKSLLHHDNARHVFLIRNPIDMLDGWQRRSDVHKETSSLEALCLPQLVDIYSEVRTHGRHAPIVVDAEILQRHPREVLQIVCAQLGVAFEEAMLSWSAGPKPDMDGLWAPHWYASAHQSTGFYDETRNGSQSRAKYAHLHDDIELLREALPFYDLLRRHAIGVNPLNPGSSSTTPDWSAHLSILQTGPSAAGTVVDHGITMQRFQLADPRNADVFAWVGNRLLPREQAKVSAFDSAVQGGDAVWEGLRVYHGRIFKLDEHLHRLLDSAKAMAFTNVPTATYIRRAIACTLRANDMTNDAHIRLTLTRGPKITSSMNPVFNIFGCTLIVLPEWKPVGDVTTYDNTRGIKLITAAIRRNPAQCVDSKIHHCNLINNILPKIQANNAGAADALMLDVEGFVSETNATNVFLVKNGKVYTPTADSCLPGVTRQTVIDLCATLNISCEVRRLSLTEFYAADEVFTTGTMGELTPVCEIDGRVIAPARLHQEDTPEDEGIVTRPVTQRIQAAYRLLTASEGTVLEEIV